jgi:hypothetical protein
VRDSQVFELWRTSQSRRSIYYWRKFRRWQDGVKEIATEQKEQRSTRVYLQGGHVEMEDPGRGLE